MRHLLVPFGTTLLLWTIGFADAVTAQDSLPADAIPDSASVVVRWKTPQATVGKLADFVDVAQPGFGAFIRPSLPGIGDAIGIPGLTGVDVDRDFWAIIFAESQETPGVVFVVTAKDIAVVKKAIDDSFTSHIAGNLVLLSQDEDALTKVRQRMSGEGTAMSSRVDAASKAVLDAADISAFVNVKQLTEEFSAELDQAELQLDALIDQITGSLPDEQRTQMEAIFDIYRQLGKALLVAARDTNSLASGLSFSKTAIRYEDRVQVADGTATSKFLAKQPPGEMSLFNRLPVDKSAYVGAKFDLSGLMEMSMNATKLLLMKNATPKQSAQFDEAAKEMGKIKYDEMLMYFDLDGKAPALRAGGVVNVTPTKAFRDVSRKLQNSMSEISAPGFSQKTKLEQNAEKIAGNDVDRVTVTQEFDNQSDPYEIQKHIHEVLFGDGGMQQLFMYQANRTLQTFGGGTGEMQSLLTAMDSTSSKSSIVGTTRQRSLAKFEKANLIALIDLSRLAVSGIKLAAAQNVLPIDASAIDSLKFEPSFVSYGLALSPNSVRTQWEIPVEQVQNIVKIVFFVRSPQ